MMEYFFFPRAIAIAKAWPPTSLGFISASGRLHDDSEISSANDLATPVGVMDADIPMQADFRIPPPGAVIENGFLKANTNFPARPFAIHWTAASPHPLQASTPPRSKSEKALFTSSVLISRATAAACQYLPSSSNSYRDSGLV